MNLTDDEMKKLNQWAKEKCRLCEEDSILTPIDNSAKSYWDAVEDEVGILDYEFSTVPDFKKLIENHMDQELIKDILNILTVATFKRKKEHKWIEDAKEDNQKIVIPEFVYTI